MKRLSVLALVVCVAITAACGGDTHEKLAGQQQKLMEDFVAVLERIKDAETARAEKPALKSIVERMKDLNARESKLPPPTEAETKALMDTYGKAMESTMMKFQAGMMKIMFNPAIQAELKDVDLQGVGK